MSKNREKKYKSNQPYFDDDNATNSGSAYVYTKPSTGWADSNQENAKLTASDAAAADYFGISVSISGDHIVIGAPYDDDNGSNSGSAYLFKQCTPTPDQSTLADLQGECSVDMPTPPTATDNCAGTGTTITGTTTATFPMTESGTITWTYDDGNGNTSTQDQTVTVLESTNDITTTTVDFVITANNSNATSYQWINCDDNNSIIEGANEVSYTPTENGNYAVIIVDGACTDTSDCVTIEGLSVNENKDLNISIYPNPNNGQFYVTTSENDVNIAVYTVDGKVILNNLKITENNQLINLSNVETGVYFVKVSNETIQNTVRLIIE